VDTVDVDNFFRRVNGLAIGLDMVGLLDCPLIPVLGLLFLFFSNVDNVVDTVVEDFFNEEEKDDVEDDLDIEPSKDLAIEFERD